MLCPLGGSWKSMCKCGDPTSEDCQRDKGFIVEIDRKLEAIGELTEECVPDINATSVLSGLGLSKTQLCSYFSSSTR